MDIVVEEDEAVLAKQAQNPQANLGSLQFHFSYNFKNGMWLKLAGHTGAFTRAGVDFNVGILGYQRMLAGGGQAKTDGE